MAICKFCGKEMVGAASCAEYHILVDGKKYDPIPYKKRTDIFFGERLERCPGCNVKSCGFHHVGCGFEICPICKNHWIYCRCSGIKVKKDGDC